ncbi:MAG: PspC domain-containing protein [Cytophagales bacterium]|nr:PspC domain-containing protein [Cytophagales bacterium]
MKKTISINIGGNIFHIEEEGFKKLKSYLDSVYTFFSTFEDSKEITDDIENRIAEKFYGELKKNKEAISAKQVDELIASMGTVADFEATLDDEPVDQKQKDSKKTDSKKTDSKQTQSEEGGSKKLYRNSKEKILGGVAGGIASYFSIDPIWIRLLWIIFTLTFGIGLIAYIILWIVLPESDQIEDKSTAKKFFRNPDGRVLGGVAGGISSYFGIDAALVRIIFLVSIILGGSGLILYIILWIITPEAQSVTEKMEMKGEPLTMKGIEKNVKKTFKLDEEDENVFVKIFLFPFRLIAMVFEGLGKMMGPVMTFVIEAVRVVFGAGVLLTGFAVMISLIFTLLFMLGVNWNYGGSMGHIDGFPIADFMEPFGPLASVSTFFLFFIPALGISLLGLTILLKRRIGNSYVALSMVLIWILAVAGCSFTVPKIVGQFSSDNTNERNIEFDVTEATPTLKLNDLDWETGKYEGVDLRLRGHEDNVYLVVIRTKAWGSSNENARENAAAVEYNVEQKGDNLIFDSRLTFGDAKFRFQNMDVTLYVPYGKQFKMDLDLDEIIVNTLHLNGYRSYQMDENTWVFNEDGIDCVTCDDDERGLGDYTTRNGYSTTRNFDFYDFNEVKVSSAFRVKVYQNEEYSVKLKGRSRDLEKVYIQQSDQRITIRSEEDRLRYSKDITVIINMPSLEYFRASGECKGDIEDFDNERIELELSGESDFRADIDPEKLVVDLSGGAKLNVQGDADDMEAEISGAAYLNSIELDVKNVTIYASGNSNTKVFADGRLTVEASSESRVEYRGTNDVTIEENGESRVREN